MNKNEVLCKIINCFCTPLTNSGVSYFLFCNHTHAFLSLSHKFSLIAPHFFRLSYSAAPSPQEVHQGIWALSLSVSLMGWNLLVSPCFSVKWNQMHPTRKKVFSVSPMVHHPFSTNAFRKTWQYNYSTKLKYFQACRKYCNWLCLCRSFSCVLFWLFICNSADQNCELLK